MAKRETLLYGIFWLLASSTPKTGAFIARAFQPYLHAGRGSHDGTACNFPSLLCAALNDKTGTGAVKDEEWEGRSKEDRNEFLQRAKRWVIVVDDEEAIRLAVGDFLYDVGYQVTACADAEAFREVLSQAAALELDPSSSANEEDRPPAAFPDAIVCDIRMPGMDGLQLLSMIRADRRLSRVPVILLTAKAMTQDRKEGYLAGADAYLPKPFSPEELLSIVDNLIRRREEMAGSKGKLVDLRNEMADIKQLLRQKSQRVVKSAGVSLTPVETEVLQLLAQGLSNGEIAAKRGVGIANVNRSIQDLYLKTRTETRTQLVRWAIETGQVPMR